MEKSEEEIKEGYKKFFEGFEKCPICGGEMTDCNEVIIKETREATRIFNCSNCEILVGKHS